ncbi:LysR family transcriptional regulator [Aliirhizobium smilacinae]|uniref:LysR family transcriptional regulator n=1 Tax=Aliirhizobium smilacinae TaxID=1395944 RepID=A0A5C4XQT8_9HYPH|nr:LysR family transcriptional regulator [Rhizobium smilacinae]TNM65718.1 LysR family transcriptional regulator [Rhizobium smilacinae]
MNEKPTLSDLSAFTTIIAHRSFRKAAEELGLSPSTLSHMMRGLETRMGVRLLNRTTRSVSPTEAGERLAAKLGPALRELDAALEAVDDFRGGPSGTIRINTSSIVIRRLLENAVPTFLARYPDVALDLVSDGRLIDIVADGFDAGIRLRESVPQDMIAIAFGGPARFVTVASPDYIASRGEPSTPQELSQHACIRLRMPSGKLYRWEFERRGEETVVDVSGPLTLDDTELMVEAAASDLGIAYVPQHLAQDYLRQGRLVAVLSDWCPEIDGLCLYYPGHRHVPAGLRAFIDILKEIDGKLSSSLPAPNIAHPSPAPASRR